MTPPGFDMLPLDGPGRSHYPKPVDTRWQEAEVLITVKAAPQPSQKYGDTVCVAGIRMTDHGPEWVRLYPVPFRSMSELEQFSKYEVLKLKIQPATDDFRAESFKPNRESIQHLDKLPPWKARHRWVSPLVGEWSMCRIQREQREHSHPGHPSLAAIRPQEVSDVLIEKHKGWNADQQAKLANRLQQDSLFGESAPTALLEPPRFRVKYRYRCEDDSCSGHDQTIIDWELSEFVRKHHRYDSDEVTKSAIRQRFLDELVDPARGPVLFVGNLMSAPRAFNVLGVYRTISAK